MWSTTVSILQVKELRLGGENGAQQYDYTEVPAPRPLLVFLSPSGLYNSSPETRTSAAAPPTRLCSTAENSGIQMNKQIQGKGETWAQETPP